MDTLGQLHQLQICKLLQHKDMVVCLEGLNGKLEALQFTFQELPLWNTATPSKPAHKPQLIEVDLSSMQPESMTTDIQVPPLHWCYPLSGQYMEPPSDIAMAINLQLQGALEWLQWASPTASAPVSQCSMLRREHIQWPGGSALNRRNRRSPQARGDGLSHPCPNGNPHTDISIGGHAR